MVGFLVESWLVCRTRVDDRTICGGKAQMMSVTWVGL